MNEEKEKAIIDELNNKIGDDISDLSNAEQIEKELTLKRNELQSSLNMVSNKEPVKLSDTLQMAEKDRKELESIKQRKEVYIKKYKSYTEKWEPILSKINKDFEAAETLHEVVDYLKTFQRMIQISKQLKQCNDNEQSVQLLEELREQCLMHVHGHETAYMKQISNTWHTIVQNRLSESYGEVLKQLNWPYVTGAEYPPPTKEIMAKFTTITKCLFSIKQPNNFLNSKPDEMVIDEEPCLPVALLLRPIKKRFAYHFGGSRQTARIDRPEWFMTQTLIWIREHQDFVKMHVQPVADGLGLKHINTVVEFNEGLIQIAAERLYDVLTAYQNAEDIVDADAAFAHAVDETLGFHRELILATNKESNSVLSVLTKANVFIQWLAVEKKYALYKLDDILENSEWMCAVCGGASAAVGAALWVPRGAHLFITLLDTIQDRYKLLPQPGHRLQFLELQLELVEEWRIRLTQILSASVIALTEDSFLEGSSPHPLTATINAAHHTTTVLLHYTHSLHYLQLHYYRRQFQHFTQQQHHDEDEDEAASVAGSVDVVADETKRKKESQIEDTMSLKEVEVRARKLALNEASRQASVVTDEDSKYSPKSPIASFLMNDTQDDNAEESTVFGEAPSLLAHLRDAGLTALAEHILLEFKATLKDYKKLKWHSMPAIEDTLLCISPALCRPLSGLCARLNAASDRLAPPLTARLRANLAAEVDTYMYQEIVLESWFNTGGITQFTHDVKRNLAPAFAPPSKTASQLNQLPRLLEACKLLNMDFDDARRLRTTLHKNIEIGQETLITKGIRYISEQDTQQILSQRTDLSQTSQPASVLELF